MDLRVLAVIGDVTSAVGMLPVQRLAELALHILGRGRSGRLVTVGLVCIFGHGCSPSSLCSQLWHGRTRHTTSLVLTLALFGVPLAHARGIAGLVDVIHRYSEGSRQLERRLTGAHRSPGPLAVVRNQHHGGRGDVGRRLDESLNPTPAAHEGREVIPDRLDVHRHPRSVDGPGSLRCAVPSQPSGPPHPAAPLAGTSNHVMRRLYDPHPLVVRGWPFATRPYLRLCP